MANLVQIKKHLKSLGISFEVIDLGGEIYTVKGVADVGVEANTIVKTLIVRTNNEFVALAVRGTDRVDFKKVRRLFGSKSELAKPEEIQKVVGVPVGAVCPVLVGLPLFFDQRVLALKWVNLGSGDSTKGLEIDLVDLLKAVGNYEVADLVL